jgi:hypothetical protein
MSNSNGISFGLSGSTLTASVAGAGAVTSDFYDNLRLYAYGAFVSASGYEAIAFGGAAQSYALGSSLHVNMLGLEQGGMPFDITAGTFQFDFQYPTSAANSLAFSSTMAFGVYTSTGGTLSLLNSFSASWGQTLNAGNSSNIQGNRFLTVASSQWSSSPVFAQRSKYWFGLVFQTAGTVLGNAVGVLNGPVSNSRSGTIGVSQVTSNNSQGMGVFFGDYSATTTGMPASIANSELSKATTLAGAVMLPHIQMINNTALSAF